MDCRYRCGVCAEGTCDSINGTCAGGCASTEAVGPNCVLRKSALMLTNSSPLLVDMYSYEA